MDDGKSVIPSARSLHWSDLQSLELKGNLFTLLFSYCRDQELQTMFNYRRAVITIVYYYLHTSWNYKVFCVQYILPVLCHLSRHPCLTCKIKERCKQQILHIYSNIGTLGETYASVCLLTRVTRANGGKLVRDGWVWGMQWGLFHMCRREGLRFKYIMVLYLKSLWFFTHKSSY